MFKVGGYYISVKGYLVKILHEFPFKDGAVFTGAAYLPQGPGWYNYRFKADGSCIADTNISLKVEETFENYLTYMRMNIQFDRTSRTWNGQATDPNGNMIVNLANLESQDRALKLLSMGAQEKLLTWMRESGYVDEMDEEAT